MLLRSSEVKRVFESFWRSGALEQRKHFCRIRRTDYVCQSRTQHSRVACVVRAVWRVVLGVPMMVMVLTCCTLSFSAYGWMLQRSVAEYSCCPADQSLFGVEFGLIGVHPYKPGLHCMLLERFPCCCSAGAGVELVPRCTHGL